MHAVLIFPKDVPEEAQVAARDEVLEILLEHTGIRGIHLVEPLPPSVKSHTRNVTLLVDCTLCESNEQGVIQEAFTRLKNRFGKTHTVRVRTFLEKGPTYESLPT